MMSLSQARENGRRLIVGVAVGGPVAVVLWGWGHPAAGTISAIAIFAVAFRVPPVPVWWAAVVLLLVPPVANLLGRDALAESGAQLAYAALATGIALELRVSIGARKANRSADRQR